MLCVWKEKYTGCGKKLGPFRPAVNITAALSDSSRDSFLTFRH